MWVSSCNPHFSHIPDHRSVLLQQSMISMGGLACILLARARNAYSIYKCIPSLNRLRPKPNMMTENGRRIIFTFDRSRILAECAQLRTFGHHAEAELRSTTRQESALCVMFSRVRWRWKRPCAPWRTSSVAFPAGSTNWKRPRRSSKWRRRRWNGRDASSTRTDRSSTTSPNKCETGRLRLTTLSRSESVCLQIGI